MPLFNNSHEEWRGKNNNTLISSAVLPSATTAVGSHQLLWCIRWTGCTIHVYPLPHIQDTLDTLSFARWFIILYLPSGYWQVELTSKACHSAHFCTRTGLFDWNFMPCDLCNAPATFQGAPGWHVVEDWPGILGRYHCAGHGRVGEAAAAWPGISQTPTS